MKTFLKRTWGDPITRLKMLTVIASTFIAVLGQYDPWSICCQAYVISIFAFTAGFDLALLFHRWRKFKANMRHLNYWRNECERLERAWQEAKEDFDLKALPDLAEQMQTASNRYCMEAQRIFPEIKKLNERKHNSTDTSD